ncbi:hypothetical protein B0I00_1379 [Novosphingobium kunmingense]|uniref:DUF4129 domain-containing protein n=1 Tax=Novosphingobium kunmingense TaxID=1211806 RepID=A0A2N0HJN2_9SPHN|nr:hypothetical protein [Novosphingobium kunmingense]PKB19150.1 hypothetical protein B0I00_1379 [Novosphingobium kunmingense]
MLVTAPAIPGAEAAGQAAQDWQAVHADVSIQYAPLPPVKVPEPAEPEWLLWLAKLFEPIARALGTSWPVLKWGLLALAAAFALYVMWRLTEPLRERLSPIRAPSSDSAWTPDRATALALLEDADNLAAEGRFDEATHLLLRRSVSEIARVRPDWVHPATTAREIAALPALPAAARQAFGVIAGRVERSLFALTALDRADWQAARAAYADFALASLPREAPA